jgi:hypothetical protein
MYDYFILISVLVISIALFTSKREKLSYKSRRENKNNFFSIILFPKFYHLRDKVNHHRQKLRKYTHNIGYCQAFLLPTASMKDFQLPHVSSKSVELLTE